jgi:hypothetical protein
MRRSRSCEHGHIVAAVDSPDAPPSVIISAWVADLATETEMITETAGIEADRAAWE